MNYYNEWDKGASAWLRQLILEGLIPPGDVDTRSISEVSASDIRGYTQCHFFAGIGGWSYALELAGVAPDRPVWTGSCPCQPFSAAGSRKGVNDERHLWPEFQRLIAECKPPVVFGEQVASKDGRVWLSTVRADLEALGYGVGAADLCAAGVGAPHIRQRLFWVAHASGSRSSNWLSKTARGQKRLAAKHGVDSQRQFLSADRTDDGWVCNTCGMGVFDGCSCDHGEWLCVECGEWTYPFVYDANDGCQYCGSDSLGKTNGFWRQADWVRGRDSKWYPVEPGTFPLGDGIPARVVQLKGYGNAIVPQLAAQFVLSAEEAIHDL